MFGKAVALINLLAELHELDKAKIDDIKRIVRNLFCTDIDEYYSPEDAEKSFLEFCDENELD